MMGNHRASCTFTMQQIGKWVVAHFKVDSNLHGHCLAISRKQCPLWILFMSQHLNPPSAPLDHRESVAWLISNRMSNLAMEIGCVHQKCTTSALIPKQQTSQFLDKVTCMGSADSYQYHSTLHISICRSFFSLMCSPRLQD